jgi:hypothetical protein
MNVTRDVISDLWPLHQSGEASADTRRLVAEYLASDPELATRLAQEDAAVPPILAVGSRPEAARVLLSRTKTLLRRRTLFLALALFFMAIAPAIATAHLHFARWGLGTAFERLPAWENFFVMGCLAVSGGFWGAYFFVRERLRVPGF